jgi:hypothetical protein
MALIVGSKPNLLRLPLGVSITMFNNPDSVKVGSAANIHLSLIARLPRFSHEMVRREHGTRRVRGSLQPTMHPNALLELPRKPANGTKA